jgi:hypothetical protein
MISVLLIDGDRGHAEQLTHELNRRGLMTGKVAPVDEAAKILKTRTASIDLVMLVVCDRSQPWLERLHQLQQSCWQSGIGEVPLFLCVLRIAFRPEFLIQIEHLGVRHVVER